MKKTSTPSNLEDQPLESLLLHFKEDKYKVSYAAIRWAKEIKQKENLPDAIPTLVPRALREILAGKITLKDIESLPLMARVAPAPAPAQAPVVHPTITLSVPDSKEEPEDEESEDEKE